MVDITSLISLQARARRNALRATRQLGRERRDADEARTAVAAAAGKSELEQPAQPSPFA